MLEAFRPDDSGSGGQPDKRTECGGADADVNRTDPGDPRVVELERRINELEPQGDAAFGQFSVWDWVGCSLICVVVPLFLFWWFAP